MTPFLLIFCLQSTPLPCLQGLPALVPQAAASSELTSASVLSKVQRFYERNKHLKAKFRQEVVNSTFGKSTISDGKVFIAKPGKMRWDFYGKKTRTRGRRVSRSFVSDGKGLFAVFHDTKQVFVKDMENDLLPVAITFLHGSGNLARDFSSKIDTSGKYGSEGDVVLELTPKEAAAQYKHLWLVVARDNFRVKESIVLNAKDDINHFRFFEPNFSSPVNGSLFEVNHPEYELVDRNAPAGRKRKRRKK